MGLNRGLNRFSGPPQPAGLPWRDRIHGSGTLATRPLASPANVGFFYLASDVGGGTIYRSTGSAWVQAAAGASAGVSSVTLTQPAAGITLTNSGISQTGAVSSVVALADDLAAIEALGGTNTIYFRSAANTWTAVTIGSNLTFSGGTLAASGGGAGSVTSVSSGNLAALFSVSIATPTTTPAFTFTYFAQSPNQVLAGPASGVTGAAPGFRALVTADLPQISATSRVLGRKTAGAGLQEELTLSDVLDFIGSAAQGDVLYRGASAWARLAAGTSGKFLQTAGAGADPAWALAAAQNVIHLRDEKTTNTDGGTFTSGAWRTRTLNTEKSDAGNLCTLASNQFTLTAGTYWCIARAPAWFVDAHRTRVQNISDGTTVLEGSTANNNSATAIQADSWVFGRFTVAGSKALELQHVCNTTRATDGFGVKANWASAEVYAEVWLIRES